MHPISCPPGHPTRAKSIYDRQLDTALFKRLHATNFTLTPKRRTKILGPCSYNPMTIDEIYRQKSCSKYGRYHQQASRFPSIIGKSKRSCNTQTTIHSLSNIPDELQRKHEFERRYNAVRLDRQSNDLCRKRKECAPRAPPVTLYEKTSFVDELRRKQTGKYSVIDARIYGPYVKLAQERRIPLPDWYKGPARFQEKSIQQSLFSSSNRHKGKFLPIPSNLNTNQTQLKTCPGPTTYFPDAVLLQKSSPIIKDKTSLFGFLSSTERFHLTKTSFSHLGPASYKPDACQRLCSEKKQLYTKF